VAGRPGRPPGGPVGVPGRAGQLPANAIGRRNVQVPGSAVNRPQIRSGGAGLGQARPGGGQAGRPPDVVRPGGAQRPAGGKPPVASGRGTTPGAASSGRTTHGGRTVPRSAAAKFGARAIPLCDSDLREPLGESARVLEPTSTAPEACRAEIFNKARSTAAASRPVAEAASRRGAASGFRGGGRR
jgi:hypothetical protein